MLTSHGAGWRGNHGYGRHTDPRITWCEKGDFPICVMINTETTCFLSGRPLSSNRCLVNSCLIRELLSVHIYYNVQPLGMSELMRFKLSCNSRKNMQRSKQVNMGRKKFNMDPKKVGDRTSDLVFHEQLLTESPVSATGNPVHDRERPAEEYQ